MVKLFGTCASDIDDSTSTFINTKRECEIVARAVGLEYTTIYPSGLEGTLDKTSNTQPKGCYYNPSNLRLSFNTPPNGIGGLCGAVTTNGETTRICFCSSTVASKSDSFNFGPTDTFVAVETMLTLPTTTAFSIGAIVATGSTVSSGGIVMLGSPDNLGSGNLYVFLFCSVYYCDSSSCLFICGFCCCCEDAVCLYQGLTFFLFLRRTRFSSLSPSFPLSFFSSFPLSTSTHRYLWIGANGNFNFGVQVRSNFLFLGCF